MRGADTVQLIWDRWVITYSRDDLGRLDVVVGETETGTVGFYALGPLQGETMELEALFVSPPGIGKGFGLGAFIDNFNQTPTGLFNNLLISAGLMNIQKRSGSQPPAGVVGSIR